MKRNRPHVIDEEAMRLFRDSLPPEWVACEQRPDYGKDYLVEVTAGEELTGVNFFVQLKGTGRLKERAKGAHVAFELDRDKAAYYADKVRQPVFLFVVDVPRRRGFWVFLQKYLREELRGTDWRKLNKVTVRLPTANRMGDTAKLLEAVRDANAYVDALHPGAIGTALRAERLRLESLDPRLDVQIVATEDRACCVVTAREPVEVTLCFVGKPEDVQAKSHRLFGCGLPVSFTPDELSVTGSPLLEEAFRQGGTLHVTSTLEVALALTLEDGRGKELARLDVPGVVTGGDQQFRLRGSLADSLVEVETQGEKGVPRSEVTLRFDFTRWHGVPVLALPFADQVTRFILAARKAKSMRLLCSFQGNPLFGGATGQAAVRALYRFEAPADAVRRAGLVAGHFRVNPALPADFGRAQDLEVQRLFRLVEDGEFREPVGNARITLTVDRPDAAGLGAVAGEPDGRFAPLSFISVDSRRLPFLGSEVEVGRLEDHFTQASLSSDRKELLRRLSKKKLGSCRLEFRCGPECERVVRRLAEGTAACPDPPG
jgi:hypothetical protein